MAIKLHAITKAFNQATVQCTKHDASLKAAVDKHLVDNKAAQAALWEAWQAALLAAVQGDNIPLLQISEKMPDLSKERYQALTNANGEQGDLRELFTQNNNKVWVVKKKTQLTNDEQVNLVGSLANPFEVVKAQQKVKTPLQQAQTKVAAALKIADQCRDFFDVKDLTALTAILSRMQTALAKAQELDAVIGENLPVDEAQAAASTLPKAKAAASTLPKAAAQAAAQQV